MTEIGIKHLLSAIYLSGIISLAVSLNEHRDPRRILRETFRRWAKFLGLAALLGLLISVIIATFA